MTLTLQRSPGEPGPYVPPGPCIPEPPPDRVVAAGGAPPYYCSQCGSGPHWNSGTCHCGGSYLARLIEALIAWGERNTWKCPGCSQISSGPPCWSCNYPNAVTPTPTHPAPPGPAPTTPSPGDPPWPRMAGTCPICGQPIDAQGYCGCTRPLKDQEAR